MPQNTSPKFSIHHIDHVVFTVKDPQTTADFYQRVAGMTPEHFGVNKERIALKFGEQKLNLHQAGNEFKPHATHPTPGSVDICFITKQPLNEVMQHVRQQGVTIEEGPVQRTGAQGPIQSFYFRDPDGNLVEIANYPAIAVRNAANSISLSPLHSPFVTGAMTWAFSHGIHKIMQRATHAPAPVRSLAGITSLMTAMGTAYWCQQPKNAPIAITKPFFLPRVNR
jgi:catechol 2,3-dioxygenase-like lactoylglutathione lyase family enzyme